MIHRKLVWALALSLASLGVARASADEPHGGYLAPGEFNVASVLQPAPRPGDPRYDADRFTFRATRALAGSPRWALATSDVRTSDADMLRNFSCAIGVELTPANSPRLVAVARQAGIDTSHQARVAKEIYRRLRPFMMDRGNICQPRSDLYDKRAGRMSYDYPSGHTTWGWTWALVMTSLAPDRAQWILERGRAYGDSRFVCGAHNQSAVEAGMLSASATMAVVSTKAAYQSDLALARAELDALRVSASPAQGCVTQFALVREPVLMKIKKNRNSR